MLNFLNLKSKPRPLFFWVASTLSTLWVRSSQLSCIGIYKVQTKFGQILIKFLIKFGLNLYLHQLTLKQSKFYQLLCTYQNPKLYKLKVKKNNESNRMYSKNLIIHICLSLEMFQFRFVTFVLPEKLNRMNSRYFKWLVLCFDFGQTIRSQLGYSGLCLT